MEKDDDDQEKVSGRNKLRATRKFILVLSVTNGSDWQHKHDNYDSCQVELVEAKNSNHGDVEVKAKTG